MGVFGPGERDRERPERPEPERHQEAGDALLDEFAACVGGDVSHGCAEVVGGYSREKMYLLNTVVSTYESQDIIKLVCDVDPGAVINVFHTLNFVGGWWGGHVDEPMPTAVPDPDKPARMASRQARLSEQDSLQQDDGK